MNPKDFTNQIEILGALRDPVRRKLYLHVAGQTGDVGRDQAARATGVTRALAAFHLDRLVAVGLLEPTFRRVSGRSGPGAGRPSKLYRRAGTQVDVSLPQRRYEWAAQMLTQALSVSASDSSQSALREAAHARGARLGRELRGGRGRGTPLRVAMRALGACGFEPDRVPNGQVVLRNCPFDSLREGCREVVCGMNLALIEGVLDGLELPGVKATLEPAPDTCCVALRAVEQGERSPASG